MERSGTLLLETRDQLFIRVECGGVLLLETRDQPFTPISSTTIEPIVLKICMYVELLSKTAMF